MSKRMFVIVAAGLLAFAPTFAMPAPSHAQTSPCAGDKVDGSTAETARKKIHTAGYHHVRDLKKGCDSYWHGKAEKDGQTVNVVLATDGSVTTEEN